MTELKDSVILPREDFLEISAAAYQNTHIPVSDRIATVTQFTAVMGVMAAGVTATALGVGWAMDWLDRRRITRRIEARAEEKI